VPKFIQITEWCNSKEELRFATDQLEKYGSKYKIEQRGKEFAVFRPKEDILPCGEAKVAPKTKSANSSTLLQMPAERFDKAITEILRGERNYSFP